MAGDILFRVWDPVKGYNAKAAIEYKPENDAHDPRYCYLFPDTNDGTGCIELASPYRAERRSGDGFIIIFEGDLIRAFVGEDDVIYRGLVQRQKYTGEWVVFDDVILYDAHGNAYMRTLETCSKARMCCLSHIQITGNIHDYKKD